jgi:hypothetical protein
MFIALIALVGLLSRLPTVRRSILAYLELQWVMYGRLHSVEDSV